MNAQRHSLSLIDSKIYIFLLSIMSVHVYLRASGCLMLLGIFSSLLCIISSFIKRPGGAFYFLMVIYAVFCIRIIRNCTFDSCVDIETINVIRAKVIYDSSFTQSGNHMMTVRPIYVESLSGVISNARGLVTVIGKEKAIITSGSEIYITGKFDEGIFRYDSLTVTGKTALNTIREILIGKIEHRIGSYQDEASLLGIQLLLGRSEDSQGRIKQKAQNCGCLHVLALSGMHLNVVTSIFRKPKFIQFPAVLAFVFIAGPRPSLIRAFLMFILDFLPPLKRLLWSLIIQSVLFPYTLNNLGCSYTYMAITALFIISPYVSYMFSVFFGKRLGTLIGSQVSIMLLNVPLTLLTNSCWYPAVFMAGPVSGVLVSIEMFVTILILVFGQLPVLVKTQRIVFVYLEKTFDSCASIGESHLAGFLAMLAVCILVCFSSVLFGFIYKRKEGIEAKSIKFLCPNRGTEGEALEGVVKDLGAEAKDFDVVSEGFASLGESGPYEGEEGGSLV